MSFNLTNSAFVTFILEICKKYVNVKDVSNIFTGLVDEMGKVKSVKTKEQGLEIEIQAEKIIENLKIGDSIATNGVCLTVTGCNENSFKADAMYETINSSNIPDGIDILDLNNPEEIILWINKNAKRV